MAIDMHDDHMPADQRIAVVVVNYGASDLLANEMVSSGIDAESQIFVVDNFESTGERRAIATLCKQRSWTLLAQDENLGFGRAVNVGVEAASAAGHLVAFILNPDAWITPQALRALAGVLADNPGSIVSPVIEKPDGSIWMENTELLPVRGLARHAPPLAAAEPLQWLTAASIIFEIDTWRSLGGFDRDYFLYWEDVDFTYRHFAAGGRLIITPSVRAVHSVGGTQSGPASKSTLYMRYNARNRLLFARKNFGPGRVFMWLLTTPLSYYNLMKIARPASRSGAFKLFGAALKGSIEGLRVRRTVA